MRVVVGPVSTQSAESWIRYARSVLEGAHPASSTLSDEMVEIFRGYLDEWEAAAVGGEFRWEAELPVEPVEYHVHAFYRLAQVLAELAERDGGPHAPPEAEPFYLALVVGVLTALEEENAACSEFAVHLQEFWPGRTSILA